MVRSEFFRFVKTKYLSNLIKIYQKQDYYDEVLCTRFLMEISASLRYNKNRCKRDSEFTIKGLFHSNVHRSALFPVLILAQIYPIEWRRSEVETLTLPSIHKFRYCRTKRSQLHEKHLTYYNRAKQYKANGRTNIASLNNKLKEYSGILATWVILCK